MFSLKSTLTRIGIACLVLLFVESGLLAQAGLRETLEKMDRNKNEAIDPDEITPLARPFLERILKSRRRGRFFRIDRAYSITELQEAARTYFALQNGVSGREVRPEIEATIQPFGAVDGEALVPEFGTADLKFPYIQEDLDQADRTLRRSDSNRDGFIDRREAARAEWTHRNPFDDDLDEDGRLSRLELGQRYARRRLVSRNSTELFQRAMRTGSEARKKDRERDEKNREVWRKNSEAIRLTFDLLRRFDSNRNKFLDGGEIQAIGFPLKEMDTNEDSRVTREELLQYVSTLQQAAVGDDLSDVPEWFYDRDTNRDKQVSMAEFTDDWDEDKIREFNAFDANRDGLVTLREIADSLSPDAGDFANEEAQTIPPKRSIISEIEIAEDLIIENLKLKLSLTHTNASKLDAYLTGPDGKRIELFTAVGGSDDNFDGTVFDDKASNSITRGRPPFRGSYRPEAIDKKQPGLSSFKGQNAKGVWQLVIRATRSERFGLLHSWSLEITPAASQPAGDDEVGGDGDGERKDSRSDSESKSVGEFLKELIK